MPRAAVLLPRVTWATADEAERARALRRPAMARRDSLAADVAGIIAAVRAEGDWALKRLTRRYDGVEPAALRVPPEDFDAAESALAPEVRQAILAAIANVRRFHALQLRAPLEIETVPGVTCRRITRPIRAVGLYVPAGSAPLPSTVVMLAVPAALAGCPRRALCTPPRADGRADPAVLFAARACGVDEVWLAGGAQAIAALAYGTQSIEPVDKIFGPGNAWVTEAKQQVARDPDGAALDLPAGPSEVLVIADERAQPHFVAADLLAQAEHGPESQAVLVTPWKWLPDAVEAAVAEQLTSLPRAAIVRDALTHARAIVTPDLDTAFEVSNRYAPEHLVLQIEHAATWLPRIEAAGSVFLGWWTPETLGDYCSGTNHVLPTYGYARSCSGLSVEDFQLAISVQEATPAGLAQLGPTARILAELEGLDAHARAVTLRLDALGEPVA